MRNGDCYNIMEIDCLLCVYVAFSICFTCTFLRVESLSSKNRMSAHNLAVVFAPTLMRAPSQEKLLVQDLPIQKYFIECIILKHDILFI